MGMRHIHDPLQALAMVWLDLVEQDGVAVVPYDDLGIVLSRSPRTVERVLAGLLDDGWIVRLERERDSRGRWTSGRYSVVPPA